MKILQLVPELNFGGVEFCVAGISAAIVADGHESVVVSNGGRLVEEIEAAGARHIQLPVHKKSPLSLGQIRPLRKLIQREAPDVVHAQSRMPAWLAWFALRGMRGAVPKFVTSVHGLHSVNRYSAIMTKGDAVIAVSKCAGEYVVKGYPKCSPERIHVIARGVDPQEICEQSQADWRAEWHKEFPQTEGKQLITLPGRITRGKGHHHFVNVIAELVKRHPDVHGVIAGGVDARRQRYYDEVVGLIDTLGLGQHVTITGVTSAMPHIMKESTAACSLSLHPESFGLTTLEALCAGTPVAAYSIGGVVEVLSELFPSGLVPPNDTAAVCDRLSEWLGSPPSIRPNTMFTRTRMLDETLKLYRSLTDATPAD